MAPDGIAYGLDMTDEMLALARQHQANAGVTNARFLRGQIEDIPLPNGSVDVVISNCVVNLSVDKPAVFREAYRVLRPGGRLAIMDVVVVGSLPAAVRSSLDAWAGCVAGALEISRFATLLEQVGFVDIAIEPVRTYDAAEAYTQLTTVGFDAGRLAAGIAGRLASAFIRASKPAD